MTNTLTTDSAESGSSSGFEDESSTRVRLRDLASADRVTQVQFVSGTSLLAAMGGTLSVMATSGSLVIGASSAVLGGIGLMHYREVSRALEGGAA